MQQRALSGLLSVLMLFPLAACSAGDRHADDGKDDAGNAASATPPIHVTQTMVVLREGKPAREDDYRQALADCQQGPMPTQPLGDDVVGKLGRTYYDLWYQGARLAERAEHWDFQVIGTCQFKVVHEQTLAIVKPGEAIDIDLVGRTGTRQHSDGVVRQARADAHADDKFSSGGDDDAALRAAVAAQLGKQGQGDLMAQSAGTASAAGQPCQRIAQPTVGEACVWSGGKAWGFSSDVVDDGEGLSGRTNSIVLWRHPPQGNGREWATQKMTVGQTIDGKVFEVPSGVAINASP